MTSGPSDRSTRLRKLRAFLESYWEENWTSPTVREIADHMGWTSPATAHEFLYGAERDGFVEAKRLSDRRVLYRPGERIPSGRGA